MAKKLTKKDYIDGKLLMRRNIIASAIAFKRLLGKYVLYVFDDNTYIEVFYRKTSFSHLTGVGTDLNATEFYKKRFLTKYLLTSLSLANYIHMI